MNIHNNWLKWLLLAAAVLGTVARAEDIDIFTGTTEVNASLPNVIFVLDNSANWSNAAQHWPDAPAQGMSEITAIKTALAAQVGKLNVGFVEYVTGGSSADTDAGYVRHDLQELNATSLAALNLKLDTIYNNITTPGEKRSASNPYANLPWDFYNYLSGSAHSNSGTGTPTTLADAAAYASQWNQFRSPLNAVNACGKTYLFFIGNNSGSNTKPTSDSAANTTALKALYTAAGITAPDALFGDTGTPLPMPGFACTVGPDVIITPEIPGHFETETVTGAFHPAESGKNLGTSAACYKQSTKDDCTAAEKLAGGKCLVTAGTTNCSCDSASNDTTACGPGEKHWNVVGDVPAYTDPDTTSEVWHPTVPAVTEPGGTTCDTSGQPDTAGGKNYNFDDWAKFLYNYGIPLTVTVDDETFSERVKVTTYTIDVFNDKQNAQESALWFSAAKVGGGQYFQARSEEDITKAINSSLGDILAVSSSFAAVSLPLSATNRARVDNQVYIGMFRPTPGKKPRWFGNLKRYQLALFNDVPLLADVNLHEAVNPVSGMVKDCAESFWSSDTGTYWEDLGALPTPTTDWSCDFVADTEWSDLPDGSLVEKGGVAQQTRQGPTADARTIYTVQSDTALRALETGTGADATALGGPTVLDYLRGKVAAPDETMPAAGLRASIHGDVVHSRPLALRHTASSVTLYYGANDGVYRAVNPADGTERWALVAPEHFGKIQRLYDNTPLIKYTGFSDAGSELKDYFFDGSTGQLTLYDDEGDIDLAYIYPTQRRGGRMVYALDVTDPAAAPDLLWRVGCPNLDNDTGCTTGFTDIGQTWSTPIGGYVHVDGSGTPKLVVAFGGGFDDCLNEDAAPYPGSCSSANGKGVYILDAATGALLAQLDTDAPVISELSSIDINFDGNLDFAYAADVAGNLYRVNFATMNGANPEAGLTVLAQDDWTIVKVGSTSDNERRFYNAPTAAAFQGTVLVTLGSGDRERPLEMNYPFAADVQNRFYALFDEPFKTFVANPVGDLGVNETTTINLDGDTMLAVVEGEDEDAPSLTEFDGWYMDLPDRGEQVANPSAIGGGKVFFNTFQPGGTSDGLCTRPMGIGTGYTISAFDPQFTEGEEIKAPGMPIPPIIATVLIPTGIACDGPDCAKPPVCENPPCECANPPCRVVTVVPGLTGIGAPPEIVPDAPPIRHRVFFTEDIDRNQ